MNFPRVLALIMLITFSNSAVPDDSQTLRVGIIGLDTSHSVAFTKQFNQEPADPALRNCRVVAAYPYGSRTIESSYSRIPKYIEDVQAQGVQIAESIDELLEAVDVVLLETNDGKPHLEQALKVFAAGKPVFIDKPVASNLAEVVAIYRASEKHGVAFFSSSALRYTAGAQAVRTGDIGDVVGCDTYSPCSLEPSHSDLFWYGIHGVEPLFTCMGVGCQSVRCVTTEGTDLAIGSWENGAVGTFRGTRTGKHSYGGTAFGTQGNLQVGPYAGYQPLLTRIADFFRTGKVPVEPKETLEIYAFMEAAATSKKNGGREVEIAEVLAHAEKESAELLSKHGL